jgi:hypothetical protein
MIEDCRVMTNVANYIAVNLAPINVYTSGFAGQGISGTVGHNLKARPT